MGKIIWLTGNSGAGKTTLARELCKKLFNWIILDGDEMRSSISLGAGFSKEAREEHNLRVARLAKILSEQGKNVIISVIAPFEGTRRKINEIIECRWVFLKRKLPIDKNKPYQVPLKPDLVLDVDNMSVEEEVKTVIDSLNLFSVFVFGLPRSGTSLATKICESLGVRMVYTSEKYSTTRDQHYKKTFGEYHPNPEGFYEITEDFSKHYLSIISNPYSGCKMIVPVTSFRWDWVVSYPCRVIFMVRHPEEIRQSQMAYFRKENISVEWIKTVLAQEKIKLRDNNIKYLEINYRSLLKDSLGIVQKMKNFINSPYSIQNALKVIKPNLNRFKHEELISGL